MKVRYLDLVVGKLVDIYNKDFAEIDRITSENAHRIFGSNFTQSRISISKTAMNIITVFFVKFFVLL